MKRKILGTFAAVAVGLTMLACAGGGTDEPDQPTVTSNTAQPPTATTKPPTGDVAPPKRGIISQPRISEGVYSVGEDMAPGTWKVTERASEGCYWAITDPKSGNILRNGYAAGFPKVTVKKGEEFEFTDCPDFEKVK